MLKPFCGTEQVKLNIAVTNENLITKSYILCFSRFCFGTGKITCIYFNKLFPDVPEHVYYIKYTTLSSFNKILLLNLGGLACGDLGLSEEIFKGFLL